MRRLYLFFEDFYANRQFTHKEDGAYHETFSPISKESLPIIMKLVAHFNVELHQMDVKIVFLNGTLRKRQTDSLQTKKVSQLVCRFKKYT